MFPTIQKSYSKAQKRLILLDYDGTLTDFAPTPKEALPTAAAILTLKKLSADGHNTVVIISGRPKNTLDEWFGHLPLQFVAEHGAFEKRKNKWLATVEPQPGWKEKIRAFMRVYTKKLAGSFIEENETVLVFHYRKSPDQIKALNTASSMLKKLKRLTKSLDLVAVHSNKKVEVLAGGSDKGKAATAVISREKYDFVLCAGDDSETDENMFKALKARGFCLKVGRGKTNARYRVKNPTELIGFLDELSKLS